MLHTAWRVLLPAPLLTCTLLTAPAGAAHAQSPGGTAHDARPVATAVRTAEPLRIDGRLDEPAWSAARVFDAFRQIDPDEGAPATQRTEVRILYDDEALYIGARLHDTGRIIGRLGRRDMPLGDSDWFGVMLDTYHDHRTAFGFDVNPAGVKRDEVKVIETDDNSWDPVWDVATTVDESGWTVEYRIPFSQLRFSASPTQVWGLQLERLVGRTREYSVSTFIPKSAQGGVPGYGHLAGLEGLRPGRRLELLPYAVARAERVDRSGNPFRDDAESTAAAGLDLKYRVTSNLTLDATVNPDFGQVEVDPAVINLGVYETQFEEKRPFFIEGSEMFELNTGGGGQLFYTRRIGRAPQLRPGGPADVPSATRIAAAAKLSGRTSGGWSLGVMEAVTREERSRYLDGDAGAATATAEPLTNYFVGRARRDLRSGASAAGGLLTMVHRDVSDPLTVAQLRSAAYAAAVDFRHEWDDRRWALRGAIALTHVRGDTAAIRRTQRAPNHYFQRPDATHLEVDPEAESLTGVSSYLSLGRQAGEHWVGSLSLATTTPGYEVNDLGFGYRTDRRDAQLHVRYQENRPARVLRNWWTDARARFEYNTANQLIANWLTVGGYWRTLGYHSVQARVNHSLRSNDDRLTRGGPLAVRPSVWEASLSVSSDGRKPLQATGAAGGSRDEFDGWSMNALLTTRWRPSSWWSVTMGPTYARRSLVAQYVTTVPDPAAPTYGAWYVFAPLDYTELGLETRLNMAVRPGLSLEVFLQPLLSAGDYGDPMYLAEAGSYSFAPYDDIAPVLDFNVRSLRGNAVIRWDWRRGSTLYLAWQQSRQGFAQLGDFDFQRDRRALWDAQPDNIFVVKVNYWLNP